MNPACILHNSPLSDWSICAVSFCWNYLLPFLFSHVGIWYQDQTFGSVPPAGEWCVNRRSEGSHPCLALWSHFLSYSWIFAKEVFWFNCSLLDYVIMALEFFIRSFLSWSLGLRGTCFLAFDVFEESGCLYHCCFALVLWLILWGAFWYAELSMCVSAIWDVFVVWFCTRHKSPLLFPSLQVVVKAGYCWPFFFFFGKLVFAESCTASSVLYERHSTYAWRGWVALQQYLFPLSLFLLCLEKKFLSL